MKIKMLRNALASDDSLTTTHYDVGKEYEVGEKLGDKLVTEGLAEIIPETRKKPQ